MSRNNKPYEWFGHTHSEHEWAPSPPTPKLRKLGLVVLVGLGLSAALYLPILIHDAELYRRVTNGRGCCGFVSESVMERPVTYALVDEWTTPVWTQNEARTEKWLTSDGIVDGETKFWRILQRQPIETTEP